MTGHEQRIQLSEGLHDLDESNRELFRLLLLVLIQIETTASIQEIKIKNGETVRLTFLYGSKCLEVLWIFTSDSSYIGTQITSESSSRRIPGETTLLYSIVPQFGQVLSNLLQQPVEYGWESANETMKKWFFSKKRKSILPGMRRKSSFIEDNGQEFIEYAKKFNPIFNF